MKPHYKRGALVDVSKWNKSLCGISVPLRNPSRVLRVRRNEMLGAWLVELHRRGHTPISLNASWLRPWKAGKKTKK